MRQLYEAFQPVIPVFIILFIVVVIATLFINRRAGYRMDSMRKRVDFIVHIGLMMTIIGILLLTLLPSSNPEKVTQFVPFYSILDTFEYATDRAIINSIGMNVLLFVPFGLFMYLFCRNEFLTTIIACLFSITVEALQYFLPIGRISNVDDVILNTLGAIIGMVVGAVFSKLGIVYYFFGAGKESNKH
ncbi:VanZ family protein [Salinicoccus sp. ID82-1]|uniref:VanZ family protein n=1 Tax=Salinicoccus cyprini TaxID=2493691 RepID=A0A558ATV7_9STAP|nr:MULTISPECIES: VanZ family protein [Salinicoccus]MCG1010814.1 VanZ family protein [Salinicoccus sp. ID82-1]TVT27704.1 VanZ family protein [Salinicoccus cyprini]